MSLDTDSRFGVGLRRVATLVLYIAAGAAHLSPAGCTPETQVTKIKVNPAPSLSTEIRFVSSFPTDKDEAKEIIFSQAQHLSSDPQGRIYVSDVRACQVFVFGSDGRFLLKFGGPGQGPGDFNMPGKAVWSQGLLAVLDRGNSRVQYFDEKGRYAKAVKLTKGYSDFAIGKDGTIFAATFRGGPPEMIDAVGTDGETRFSFGRPPEALAGGAGPLFAWLGMSPPDDLFVAYWFSPVVQVYSAAGELKSVFEVQYKPMQDKLSRNQAQTKTAPGGARVIGQSIIEAIWVAEEVFFILHRDSVGRVDILEFSRDGTFLRDYWTVQTSEYYPRGLMVREDGAKKTFYLLQASPENKVDVYIEK